MYLIWFEAYTEQFSSDLYNVAAESFGQPWHERHCKMSLLPIDTDAVSVKLLDVLSLLNGVDMEKIKLQSEIEM